MSKLTDLVSKFETNLSPPNNHEFDALIQSNEQFFISKDLEGYPLLFLIVDEKQIDIGIERVDSLSYILFQVLKGAHLKGFGKKNLLMVSLNHKNKKFPKNIAIRDIFLELCYSCIRQFSGQLKTNQSDIFEFFSNNSKLLKISDISKENIIGFWGELFLIFIMKESREQLINAWHEDDDENIDFSFKNLLIEVKTTTKTERAHHFRLKQLTHKKPTYIASFLLDKQSSGGYSVIDLKRIISEELELINKVDLIKKLDFNYSQKFQGFDSKLSKLKFDIVDANKDMMFYSAGDLDIIQPAHIPKNITNIEFVMKFNNTKHISNKVFLEILKKGE